MITHIGKWGNSLAIRLPKELGFKKGEVVDVDISVDGRSIIIRRVKPLTPKERNGRVST